MTPDQVKLLIKIGILVAIAAAGAIAGWTANGWRLAGKINELQGVVDTQKQSIATLEGVNKSCAAGVDEVKGAVQVIVDEGVRRTAAAAAAMAKASQDARKHHEAAQEALRRALPAPGKECDTAAAEAATYVRKRREAP